MRSVSDAIRDVRARVRGAAPPWVEEIGLDPAAYGTHTMRRTKATLIYRKTKNLRAVRLLLGHTKLESTVRYLGIEVDDALEISEQTDVSFAIAARRAAGSVSGHHANGLETPRCQLGSGRFKPNMTEAIKLQVLPSRKAYVQTHRTQEANRRPRGSSRTHCEGRNVFCNRQGQEHHGRVQPHHRAPDSGRCRQARSEEDEDEGEGDGEDGIGGEVCRPEDREDLVRVRPRAWLDCRSEKSRRLPCRQGCGCRVRREGAGRRKEGSSQGGEGSQVRQEDCEVGGEEGCCACQEGVPVGSGCSGCEEEACAQEGRGQEIGCVEARCGGTS